MRSSKSLHTYTETNHHPRANKFQSKTYHTNSPARKEHSPERHHQAAKSHTKHIDPSQNSLLDTPFNFREKKSSSMYQNTDASFPNQETLTSQSSNPTHWEKPPQLEWTTGHQKTERPLQTQQSKEDEKGEKYPAGKGTWKMPTKPNKRGGDRESTWKTI